MDAIPQFGVISASYWRSPGDPSAPYRTAGRRTISHEINLCTKQSGDIYVGQARYESLPGRLFCFRPGEIRSCIFPYECYCLHVHLLNASAEWVRLYLDCVPECMDIDDEAGCANVFKAIIEAFYATQTPGNDLILTGRILELFGRMSVDARRQGAGNSRNSEAESQAIRQAMDYIAAHFAEPITLNDIAASAHLSSIYFHKLFTASQLETPHAYLTRLRIAHAQRLLACTDMSLSQVAFEAGFVTQSHFSNMFKKSTLISPRDFRCRYR